jgi:hypothetical protein
MEMKIIIIFFNKYPKVNEFHGQNQEVSLEVSIQYEFEISC